MSLLDDVSIVVTPNGYKAGTLFGVIPVPTLGADVITNGDFATDSDWSKGGNWSIGGGVATANGNSNGNIAQSVPLTVGTAYSVTYTVVNASAGSRIGISTNATSIQIERTTDGTYTETFTASLTSFYIRALWNNGNPVSLDNVSVKEWTGADMDVTRATAATRVDEDGLVNYAEIIGGEEVTNGDFSNGLNNWTVEGATSYASIVNGALNSNNTNAGNWYAEHIEQDISFVNGTTYKLTFKAKNISGNLNLRITQNATVIISENLTNSFVDYSVLYTANLTGGSIRLFCNSAVGQFEVDDISVKEVTRDNVPRIDYTGGGCPHILAEPQRTNLIPYSEDFSQWTEIEGALVTINSVISPSGETNSDKFTFDGTTYGRVEKNIAVTNGNTYTFSVYLKNNNLSDVTQVWLGFSMGGQGEFVTITNEWQRYETVQVANGSNEYPRVQFTGTGSLYAWGAQLEAGSYATSYIPTSGSTVTRNQDIFTRDGIGSLINSTEGVLFVEMAATSLSSNFDVISLSNGTTSNVLAIFYYANTKSINVNVIESGFSVFSGFASTITYPPLDFHKIAIKYKTGDFALWIDGTEVLTGSGAMTNLGLSNLQLADGDGTSNKFFGKVKQLQVYDTALTDTQLAALTS